MNNFCEFLTPEEYIAECPETDSSLEELIRRSQLKGTCFSCDERIWRVVDNGMCFSCTTGESDASNDYEIGDWHA